MLRHTRSCCVPGAVRIVLPHAVPPVETDPVIAAAVRAALRAK